jgi:hypothetical protein
MPDPLRNQPYAPSTFAAAAAAWPTLHPVRAAMRAMGTGAGPPPGSMALKARLAEDLAFWDGLPGADRVRAGLVRRYAERIAAAERREARATALAGIETALNAAEAALESARYRLEASAGASSAERPFCAETP